MLLTQLGALRIPVVSSLQPLKAKTVYNKHDKNTIIGISKLCRQLMKTKRFDRQATYRVAYQ